MSGSRRLTPEERIGLRLSLDPKYQDASDTELNDLIQARFGGLTEEQMESFWGKVSDIGGQVLQSAAPIALAAGKGAITGALTGGLPGALIGAAAGGVSSALSSQQTSGPTAPLIPPTRSAVVPTAVKAPDKVPSSAQLLKLLNNPLLIQSLLSLALGASGRRAIPVSGTPVAPSDFMTLVGHLASSASKEAAEDYATNPDESQNPFDDLDPAIPEHRAQALLNLLDREEQTLRIRDRDEVDIDSLQDSILTLELI